MTGRTLHPSTLRGVTKIATEYGLPLVKAEWNHIIVGDIHLVRDHPGWACGTLNGFHSGDLRHAASAPAALRAALKAMP